MKFNKIFLASAIMCGAAAFITSCDDDLDRPPVIEPLATYQPNTKIADLKEAYWQADNNYYKEIGLNEDGDSIIIGGRVISNDAAGNLYRQVILEDETGAIDFAVTMSDINTKYYYGQEVFVNVTGMQFGKYSGLCRIGAIYNGGIGRMDEADFTTKAQVNRLPNPALIDTAVVTLDQLATYKTTTEGLIRWQSRIIRLEKMTFTQGGKVTLGNPSGSSATNRTIRDASGKTIDVRTNDYSTLCKLTAPTGTGSVTAILGYFGSDWQLTLIDAASLQGFDEMPENPEPGNPGSMGDGSAANPFTVDAVMGGSASGKGVWVTGYIVGCVDTSDSNNYQYQFSSPFTAAANLLLAAKPDETNYDNCVPVQLVNGTTVRTELNLKDNAANHGKQVSIQGEIADYFKKPGLKTTTSYNWGATGSNGQGGETTESATFRKVSSITSGRSYVMVLNGKVGKAIASGSSYGRLEMVDPAATSGDNVTTDAANAITITSVTGGYTMVDTYGRYLSMDNEGHYTSFQLYTAEQTGSVWKITPEANGEMTIENVLNPGCFVGQSGTYTNIAPAQSTEVNKPVFYEKVD